MLLSAGYEFDIYVWSTMKSDPIEKLCGHEASIVGLACPSSTFNGISCDLKGVIKVCCLLYFRVDLGFERFHMLADLICHRRLAGDRHHRSSET